MTKLQWTGENFADFAVTFEPYQCTVERDGDVIRITGVDDLKVDIRLGDEINLGGTDPGFKVKRAVEGDKPDPFVIWKGDNVHEIIPFIADWPGINISVMGGMLVLEWVEDNSIIVAKHLNKKIRAFVNVGDRLVSRGRYLFVSRAGQDHRI